MQEIERIDLREGTNGEILLILHSNKSTPPEFETELPISAVHINNSIAFVLAGEDHIEMQVLEKHLHVSADSFFQINSSVLDHMVNLLLNRIKFTRNMTVMDIYSGVGLFSAFVAPLVKRCIGIESSLTACHDYAFNLNAYENVELYEGRAEMVLPMLDVKPDIAIVDPPRGGISRKALDALIKLAPDKIIYISCNPATLARDTGILDRSGYDLESTILLDMFPQTYHIESMNYFNKV